MLANNLFNIRVELSFTKIMCLYATNPRYTIYGIIIKRKEETAMSTLSAMSTLKCPEGTLENTITYICAKSPGTCSTKLMKLLYLIDLEYFREFNKTLTGIKHKSYYYGPFSFDVQRCLESLFAKGILASERLYTWKGRIANIITPKIKETAVSLPPEGKKIIDRVLQQWKNRSVDEIVEYAKSTVPFLSAQFNEDISFKNDDLIEHLAKLENKKPSEVATELVCENKELLDLISKAEAELKGI